MKLPEVIPQWKLFCHLTSRDECKERDENQRPIIPASRYVDVYYLHNSMSGERKTIIKHNINLIEKRYKYYIYYYVKK